MQASMFNVRVPLDQVGQGDDVFLMNTFTDAQLIVSREVAALLDRVGAGALPVTAEERDALTTLSEQGFIVEDRETERRQHRTAFSRRAGESGSAAGHGPHDTAVQLRVRLLLSGDHGDYNKFAAKMSLETAAEVACWVEDRLDAVKPQTFTLTLFGGEPLLNLPVAYYLAERLWQAAQARGVRMALNVITNGLLLTPEVVDRLAPFGLNAVKVTLDGDRDVHNRMRPLRGGQGTFDKIIENVRKVAGKCRISIGGNFDESSVDSYPALLDFLREQEFADKIARVAFKPVIREPKPQQPKGLIPLTVLGSEGKPLNGTCMTSAGGGTQHLRQLQLPRREDVVPARGNQEARLLDGGRRPHGPLRDSSPPRPHHWPGRGSVRLPGVHRGREAVNRPHRRPQRGGEKPGGHSVRSAGGLEGMQRLRIYSRVCRRLHGGGAHRAWQHAPAELPQEQLRSGRDLDGAGRRNPRAGHL